ncbi:hypothetical protein SADUNF_Sadunf07G0059400 [Salix dunnii]|uniref:Isopropylmalate dehydrogenase-like domain-containing protein n=1 Tax=Salix dunnii TaxID=1413687 RepID=A0A835K0B5_9ROSI|nr:hypothetical protein SADUNF_Sadunf07G0059400 [Salix dunnii]
MKNIVKQVMEALHVPMYSEKYNIHGNMMRVPSEVIEYINKNKVCLKRRLATPMGGGVSSLNVQLRKELDLYASLVNCFNLLGLPTSAKSALQNMLFEHAYLNNRKKVTVVHKENIMKLTNGLILESCREVAIKYPRIKYNKLLWTIVTPNLYGNLIVNTIASIAGGTRVMPGGVWLKRMRAKSESEK